MSATTESVAPDESGAPVSGEALSSFFDSWDRLAVGCPGAGGRLPGVYVVGPGARDLLDCLSARLDREDKKGESVPLVPHARLDAVDPESTAIQVLEKITTGWSGSMPAGWGKLRLPRFHMVCRILLAAEAGRGEDSETLKSRLVYRAFGANRRFSTTVVNALPPPPEATVSAVVQLLKNVSAPVLCSLFERRMDKNRGGWFRTGVGKALNRSSITTFGDAAYALANAHTSDRQADVVRDVLISALRQDLQVALAPGPSVFKKHPLALLSLRRRRTTPFVLLAEPSEVTGPTGSTATIIDELVAKLGSSPDTSLFVIAQRPAAPSDIKTTPLARAGEALNAWAAGKHPADTLATVAIEVPEGVGSVEWTDFSETVRPSRPRFPRSFPLAGWLAVVVVVGVAAVTLPARVLPTKAADASDDCPTIWESGGERIGIAGSSDACRFFPHGSEERWIEDKLAEERLDIIRFAKDNGRSYSDIVLYEPLTVPAHRSDDGQSALRILRGALAFQRDAYEDAKSDDTLLLVTVVLANSGERFAHEEVTPAIVDNIDDKVIGVAGLAQSRRESWKACQELGKNNLAVVADTVTADGMLRCSYSYYQVAPTNYRIAQHMVSHALTGRAVDRGNGQYGPAENAVIVTDDTDPYSRNLAEDIKRLFTEADHSVLGTYSYRVGDTEDDDEGPPALAPTGELEPITVRSSPAGVVDAICGSSFDPSRDVIFYTARSQEFPDFLGAWQRNCSRRLSIVGGDEITKVVEDDNINLGRFDFLRLAYAAFAPPADMAADPYIHPSRANRFVHTYRKIVSEYVEDTSAKVDEEELNKQLDDIAADVSDPGMVHDALYVIWNAGNKALQDQVGEVEADDVASHLRSGVIFDGVTGVLEFHGDAEDDALRSPPEKPILILPGVPADGQPLLVCGAFVQKQTDIAPIEWNTENCPAPER